MTSRDAYDSAPPRGTEPVFTRVYRSGGRYAHLRKEDGSGDIACEGPFSREDGRDDHWLGTGSQAEYEHAAGLPLHPACFSVREAAQIGIDADQTDPAEREGCRAHPYPPD
jgi:hypothetical protein